MYTCAPELPCFVLIQRTSSSVPPDNFELLDYISCSPMLLVHSFSTYLHSLFLEARIYVDIWMTSLLMFN